MMTEHQSETAFLRHIILYGDTDEHRELEKKIATVQRDRSCVLRAASLAGLCAALAVAGLGYVAILQENFPYNKSQFVIRLLCDFGLASLICLVAFTGLLAVHHTKLHRLRKECRRLATRLLKSHLGEPHLVTARGSHQGCGDREVARGAAEVRGCPDGDDSLREAEMDGQNPVTG